MVAVNDIGTNQVRQEMSEERRKLLEVLFHANRERLEYKHLLEEQAKALIDYEKMIPRYQKLKKHFLKYLLIFYSGSIAVTLLFYLISRLVK